MRAAIAFLALVVPSLSELLPPWYPTTRAPANYANQTWLDSLYPCSAAELAWIKLQTRSGAMSTDHAQHELGCRTAWRDSRNSCNWKQLCIKHNVLTASCRCTMQAILGLRIRGVPPTQSPTPVHHTVSDACAADTISDAAPHAGTDAGRLPMHPRLPCEESFCQVQPAGALLL